MQTEFVTGQAGTGKTTVLKKRLEEDPNYGIFCASTGIAALNMGEGVTTVHSLFKFFDHESCKEAFYDGHLVKSWRRLIEEEGIRRIILDECSMLDGRIGDLLYQSGLEAEEITGTPLGMVITGDFCQLPPVQAPWLFEADCWKDFAANTTKLTKVWRQDNIEFLNALNAFRSGNGMKGVLHLKQTPAKFQVNKDESFDGLTIIPKNDDVATFNAKRLAKLPGTAVTLKSFRWAANYELLKTFKAVPESVDIKDSALVMILANDTTKWEYANGSQGHILSINYGDNGDVSTLTIQLMNERTVTLRKITRQILTKHKPDRFKDVKPLDWPRNFEEGKNSGVRGDFTYYLDDKDKWVIGEVSYFPVQLSWASTVHKTQGLTLDRVQVCVNDYFMSRPGMTYVALSRVRSPEGLHIVGWPTTLANRCSIDPKVKAWL